MLSSLVLLLAGSASGAPRHVQFCFKYIADLTDAETGTYVTDNNGTYDAAYVHAYIVDEVTDDLVVWGPMDGRGCTGKVPVEDTHTHSATMFSLAHLPGGRWIRAERARDDSTMFTRTASGIPITSDVMTIPVSAVGFDNRWVNLMLIGTHTMRRAPSPWPTTAGGYLFFYEPTSQGPGLYYEDENFNVIPTPGVMIPSSWGLSQRLKFDIAHELGHLLEFKLVCAAGNGGSGSCDSTYWLQVNYDAAGNSCQVNNTDAWHYLNSKEYQSAAAIEGWAHFVASHAFNNRQSSTPRNKPNQPVPWNYIETYDPDDGHTAEPFSVLGAYDGDFGGAEYVYPPTPVLGRDTYGQFCAGTGGQDVNRGLSVDWLRYWWDFHRHSGFGFPKATQVVAAMGSHTWCSADACGDLNDLPAKRLESAMGTLSGGPALYDAIKDNGVDR